MKGLESRPQNRRKEWQWGAVNHAALMVASDKDHKEIAQLGANLNASRTADGWTALM